VTVTGSFRYPWEMPPAPVVTPLPSDAMPDPEPKPRGRRPASITRALARTAGPEWLYHHLTVSGPAETAGAFTAAARGAGVTPWLLNSSQLEDDIFNLAVSQPASRRDLTIEGCRILARQFRERVELRQARAAERVGQSLACPFDLHTLLPVPTSILQLGPAHPDALAWLSAHWGITDRLRQVAVRDRATTGRRLPKAHTVIGYGFFTLGETPQVAIDAIAARWPALRFRLQPRPAG
jgi:hypothetical protein